jgi:DNA topoisomerase IB-like protein
MKAWSNHPSTLIQRKGKPGNKSKNLYRFRGKTCLSSLPPDLGGISGIGSEVAIFLKTRESSPHRKAVRRISVIVEGPKELAIAAGLRYVSDESPGITRKRARTNFAYYDAEGKRIKDPAELKRIRGLVIPPAWENVWICPKANGHLQATGVDAKGRKQYKLSPDLARCPGRSKI